MFTHLHLHTEYSLLDATIRLPELVKKISDDGMKACALTDHGNMYGVLKFKSAMKEAGLKAILGCEIYIAPRGMQQKDFGIDNRYNHMVLLAKNLTGYKNLIKIVSIAHMEGFYYKPRVDFDTLSKYSEGIIALSGCLAGPVARPLLENNYDAALEAAKKYSELFKENFYIEIQRNGMEEQELVNDSLIKISTELNLPLVATCDSHYLNKEDAYIQEILWCINDGKSWDDPSRRKMATNEFYVKTQEEMKELFNDLPQAIENTQVITESIEDFDITFGRVEPHFLDLPEGEKSGTYLKRLALEGAKRKYGKVTKEIRERIAYELEIIDERRYNDYFLVVRDFVMFCRKNGIIVGMRGSGCGSVVAYCVDITDIEPMEWELYFERFLNPERDSPPDFDIDIADKRRNELLDYTIEKYGIDNVKQIGTFSKLQTRQAIKDVGRVLGVELAVTDKLAKMVEIVFGKAKGIDHMIEHNPEFAEIINSSEKTLELANIVRKVSGICRGTSTHACGIIVTPDPVINYCAIQRDSHGGGIGMTQFEMSDIEYVGLMKFDFLGLRNLNVIGEAITKVKVNRKRDIDLLTLDPNDKATFNLIKSGHTVGVFQLESEGMKRSIRGLQPETQEDICYLLAAYRPGPMQYISEYIAVKKGDQEPDYVFEELKPVLEVTNGVITYQEQVMKIAQIIAGYSLGTADILRRAMGKKKMDIMEKEKPKFLKGAKKNGFDPKETERLWDKLVQFANYGFNKAHSASYATIAYWTAYLKAHYPLEFMAALLEGDLDNFDRVIIDLNECERLGIDVLPPTINESKVFFTIEGDSGIRFGLGGIKNVGEDIVNSIVKERKENGSYKNLDDFIERTAHKGLQKRAIEYLIMCGSMDEFGDRAALLQIAPVIFERTKKSNSSKSMGQIDIFSLSQGEEYVPETSVTPLPEVEKAPRHQILQWEKDLLGLYFSSHPLDNLQEFFESKNVISVKEALEKKNRAVVILGVMVNKIRRITTKKGDMMAFLTVEDKSAITDIILFPQKYQEIKDVLEEGKPILIAASVNVKNNEKSLILEKAKYIDESKHGDNFQGVTFRIKPNHTEEEIKKLKEYISLSNGDVPVKIVVTDKGKNKAVILEKTIELNSDTKRWLRKF
ncbi:MAG: DNA polymerase III subunit alpha [Candidatus Dojkabacteria bacterium]|jgi:DNA polymerase-3 subunit alpha|nr:DNA polymerase III subunit alpha [Candidatus Dojkabacteria bacterium]